MMFVHMYDFVKHDQLALIAVSNSLFGSGMMTQLAELISGDLPINPWEILGRSKAQKNLDDALPKSNEAWDKIEPEIKKFMKDRKVDLITVTVSRMAFVMLDDQYYGTFDKDQVQNLIKFLDMVPEETLTFLLQKVFKPANQSLSQSAQFWTKELLIQRTADKKTTSSGLVEKIRKVRETSKRAAERARKV